MVAAGADVADACDADGCAVPEGPAAAS